MPKSIQERNMKMIPKTRVMVRTTDPKSPVHGAARGTKLQAAIPNNAGRSFGKEVPSFAKPYLVYEAVYTCTQDMERFVRKLASMGFCLTTPEAEK